MSADDDTVLPQKYSAPTASVAHNVRVPLETTHSSTLNDKTQRRYITSAALHFYTAVPPTLALWGLYKTYTYSTFRALMSRHPSMHLSGIRTLLSTWGTRSHCYTAPAQLYMQHIQYMLHIQYMQRHMAMASGCQKQAVK